MWYQRSAVMGSDYALIQLGECYLKGLGTEQDVEKGLELVKKGAEDENDFAMFLYGECLERGIGIDVDFDQAVELYKKAAEKGGEEGLYRMALLYSEGNGVEKNLEKAKEYCQQVRADLTYSDTCVFEDDWRQEVELLLASFRIAD